LAVAGEPEHISTSYVERQNLTLRMGSKRFARLSNGFSKKIDCHNAAVIYNLCRTHEALRTCVPMPYPRQIMYRLSAGAGGGI
jgi:hypothetical protein